MTVTYAQGGLLDAVVGGVIAGVFTLGGGLLAYRAGIVQARRTKEAGDEQVRALDEQLAHLRAAESQRDQRVKHSLLMALSMEASRANMMVQQLPTQGFAAGTDIGTRVSVARSFAISPNVEVRRNADLDALVSEKTAVAARTLVTRMDQLNVVLMKVASFGELRGPEVDERLAALRSAAVELEQAVSLELDAAPFRRVGRNP
ncbi:MAG TPA: hypothetical protein VN814_05225 [Caulobacteraceae bacterium]|nr:hypothetical protein [Caulobacteraceae bacterium]